MEYVPQTQLTYSRLFYLFTQGTESIERYSPVLTKYWQQAAGTCAHFQHNFKIGGKIDCILTKYIIMSFAVRDGLVSGHFSHIDMRTHTHTLHIKNCLLFSEIFAIMRMTLSHR